jgi:murein DD-endopeptidase MepM/ murein hydrolase activator NlpD
VAAPLTDSLATPDAVLDPRDRAIIPPAWIASSSEPNPVVPRREPDTIARDPRGPAERPLGAYLAHDAPPSGANSPGTVSPGPAADQAWIMLAEPAATAPTPTPRPTTNSRLFGPIATPAARPTSPPPPTPTPRPSTPTPIPTALPTSTPQPTRSVTTAGAPSAPAARTPAAPVPGGPLAWPLSGVLTQRFSSAHTGLDIAAPLGTTVKAAAAGTVVVATKSTTGYGWRIVVDHGGGYTTLYAHLSAFSVAEGHKVTRGQPIGAVGATGLATGPHLHFEVGVNGTPQDPLRYLP